MYLFLKTNTIEKCIKASVTVSVKIFANINISEVFNTNVVSYELFELLSTAADEINFYCHSFVFSSPKVNIFIWRYCKE